MAKSGAATWPVQDHFSPTGVCHHTDPSLTSNFNTTFRYVFQQGNAEQKILLCNTVPPSTRSFWWCGCICRGRGLCLTHGAMALDKVQHMNRNNWALQCIPVIRLQSAPEGGGSIKWKQPVANTIVVLV